MAQVSIELVASIDSGGAGDTWTGDREGASLTPSDQNKGRERQVERADFIDSIGQVLAIRIGRMGNLPVAAAGRLSLTTPSDPLTEVTRVLAETALPASAA